MIELIDTQKELAKHILMRFKEFNIPAILAGGAPRNWYLGNPAKDFDWYVSVPLNELKRFEYTICDMFKQVTQDFSLENSFHTLWVKGLNKTAIKGTSSLWYCINNKELLRKLSNQGTVTPYPIPFDFDGDPSFDYESFLDKTTIIGALTGIWMGTEHQIMIVPDQMSIDELEKTTIENFDCAACAFSLRFSDDKIVLRSFQDAIWSIADRKLLTLGYIEATERHHLTKIHRKPFFKKFAIEYVDEDKWDLSFFVDCEV